MHTVTNHHNIFLPMFQYEWVNQNGRNLRRHIPTGSLDNVLLIWNTPSELGFGDEICGIFATENRKLTERVRLQKIFEFAQPKRLCAHYWRIHWPCRSVVGLQLNSRASVSCIYMHKRIPCTRYLCIEINCKTHRSII